MTSDPHPTRHGPEGAQLRELAARLSQLAAELATCECAVAAAAEGRYLDAAATLGRAPALLERLAPALREAAAQIEAVRVVAAIEDGARRSRLRYREALEAALDAAGVVRAGQWPAYTLGDLLRLQVDPRRGSATLDGRRAGTLEPVRLAELAASRLTALLDGPFDPEQFLARLQAAHGTVARAPAEYVDMRAIHAALRVETTSPKRYSEVHLGVDVYRLLASGRRPTTSDGLTLELSPAQSAAAGMFIPMPGGGNFIAALRFVAPYVIPREPERPRNLPARDRGDSSLRSE